jgi:mono/diheme cytochrome c family protein
VDEPFVTAAAPAEEPAAKPRATRGAPPRFTAQQAAAGKVAYEGYCAVCHGSTLTNGTFGTPLAGDYFRRKWVGQSVHAFYEKSRTMPPSAPRSLPENVYTNAVAYILQFNGAVAGSEPLPPGGPALEQMLIH